VDIQKGTSYHLEFLRVVQAPINTGIYYLKVGCGFFVVGCSCRNIKRYSWDFTTSEGSASPDV
jgi:hypothetical protein